MPSTKVQMYMQCFLALVIIVIIIICALSINTFQPRWLLHLKIKLKNMDASASISKLDSGNGAVPSSSPLNTTRVVRRKWSVLLVYTGFFGQQGWFRITEDCKSPQLNGSCSKDLFNVTYDKGRFPESDYVLFHGRDMPSTSHMRIIWKKKPSSQFWIYFLMESPRATPDTKPLNGMFDITMTYRVDSDVWQPYGSYVEIPLKDQKNVLQEDFSVGKTKLVSWMCLFCAIFLLSYLMSFALTNDVRMVATPPPGPPPPCAILLRYASAITELKKYWELRNNSQQHATTCNRVCKRTQLVTTNNNIVPVVMGGADYSKLAIPGSYINALDFSTVKDLAEYLHYLDKNITAYNEYFKWRKRYRM
ncbi:unnamed protein product, partial [Porites evermanni]